jgi:hypothetical protein
MTHHPIQNADRSSEREGAFSPPVRGAHVWIRLRAVVAIMACGLFFGGCVVDPYDGYYAGGYPGYYGYGGWPGYYGDGPYYYYGGIRYYRGSSGYYTYRNHRRYYVRDLPHGGSWASGHHRPGGRDYSTPRHGYYQAPQPGRSGNQPVTRRPGPVIQRSSSPTMGRQVPAAVREAQRRKAEAVP